MSWTGQQPIASTIVSLVSCESTSPVLGSPLVNALSAVRDRRWLRAVCDGLRVEPLLLEARRDETVVGELPLALVKSPLFGRFLVSLPYVNWAGVVADDPDCARALIDRACDLADQKDVRYLELRHEREIEHPRLTDVLTSKLQMRLPLPETTDKLWKSFSPKVRNQVRKGEKQEFTIDWGAEELVREFHDVFSRRMRDLGTPVFGSGLFMSVLKNLPDQAEICIVRHESRAIAAALLVHGEGMTEVPSASALREYNSSNVNMLMYWQMLMRSVDRKQAFFDFGRCSKDSNTYRFKKQWGAIAEPAAWQYYVRRGSVGDMRPDNKKYQLSIAIWRRLPLWLTRILGPVIVRGIP